jgi:glycosyltransferase involved in cell wall biosynthesis
LSGKKSHQTNPAVASGQRAAPSHPLSQISVIIPALNEEQSIAAVINDIPRDLVQEIIVADNGSTDRTAEIASSLGCRVVREPRRGYGNACLKAMAALSNPDIVVFLDGDYSDYPNELPLLVNPILNDQADLVLGSRTLGSREPGALPPHSRFGNWLAGALIGILFGHRYTDLGPFRAIRYTSLQRIGMIDRNYGWTVEMQLKAVQQKLRIQEIPVSYRKRIGQSKVTGTISGSVKAGMKIIWIILKYSAKRN